MRSITARVLALLSLLCLTAAPLAQPRSGTSEPPTKEVQLSAGTLVRGAPLPAWATPLADVPPTKRTERLVLRLAETQFSAESRPAALIHRAVQVNDATALAAIGQYTIHFVPQYQQLLLHRVHVLRGVDRQDRTADVQLRVLERESGLENGVYSGVVTAVMLLEDVQVGDTLDIAYTLLGNNPVFGTQYSDMAAWDQPEPVELRRVSLRSPAGRRIRWQMFGDFRSERVKPQERVVNGDRLLVFEERGIEPVPAEPQVPAHYLPFRFIQFTEYAGWNQVATWAANLFPPDATLPEEMHSVMERLRAIPEPEQRAAAALEWVQAEIRYFSVSLGESSHRPHPPAVVVQRRYGDCKDKTLLLVTMLRQLGINATPALLSARSIEIPGRLLPSPDVFDHVVAQVRIDGATYYLDATRMGQRGALSRMGTLPAGTQVLVVGEATHALARAAGDQDAELSTIELKEAAELAQWGKDARLVSRLVFHGAMAELLRVAYPGMTVEQRRDNIFGNYIRRYPGLSLEGDPAFLDDPGRNTVTIEATFKVPNFAREANGNWGVGYMPANMVGVLKLPPQLNRKMPAVVMDTPLRARYELTVTWPVDVAVFADPETKQLDNDFFRIDTRRHFRGNTATVSVDFEARAEAVQPKDMTRMLEDMRKLDNLVSGVFVVPQSSLRKSSSVLSRGPRTIQETMRLRLEKQVDRLSETIGQKSLQGADLAEALCDRAEALADLGRPEDGLADAVEAVKVAPELPRAWHCRGNLYYASGDFTKALTDYTKGLTMGHDASASRYKRGLARFYASQHAAAAEDFAAAATEGPDDGPNLYARMFQIWALQRAGLPIPPAIEELAKKEANGPWPGPALAMQVGNITPEEVLAQIDRKRGDDRVLALAEAWFYIGQYYRARGDLPKAREAYQKARAHGITMYVEHVAAGFELAQLK